MENKMSFFTSRPVSGFIMEVGGFFSIWVIVFEQYLVDVIPFFGKDLRGRTYIFNSVE